MIRRDFQHDPDLRASFNALAQTVFDLDFETWYQGGFWDDAYACHAWVEDGQVLATVGRSELQLRIEGEPRRAFQIGTVMTHPDHRGRGLASRLMEAALAPGGPAYLFADEEAAGFYPKFGFQRVRQWDFWMPAGAPEATPPKGHPLTPACAEDLDLLQRFAHMRTPVSRRLSVQAPNLLLWWALNPLQNAFIHMPDENLILAGRRKDTLFHLYDVIAPRLPAWEDLKRCLPLEGVETVVFHFTPDLIAPEAECRPAGDDDLFFVRGDLSFGERPFRYPITGQA